ncbi:MAG: efflux transporter outer membrane subunit [Sulfurimonas sp.]|jgi:NodT family efflux transporter outer membrane factor (OMF) lipoprotein|nr:efflux transporter outer membrane subunit [Sulfurimonas sp.]
MKSILSGVVSVFLLLGCSTIEPELSLDVEIAKEYAAKSYAKQKLQERWWESFGSDELNTLIDQALEQSPDILSAYEKIQQAKIILNSAGAEYLPSLDLRANTSLGDNSDRGKIESSSASVALSYELDIWDRIGASQRAAKSSLEVSLYDYEALKITLCTDVAQSYFHYVATVQKEKITQKNLQIAKDTLDVLQARYDFGAVDELSLRRQKIAYLAQEELLYSLQNQRVLYKNALALLLGKNPSSFALKADAIETLLMPEVDAGLPSELLLSRPDIAAAQASIEANKALIQAANANRFPRFSLSGSGGLASDDLLSLNNATRSVDVGLGLTYNIFDMGRLKNQVLIEESKAKQSLQNYRKSLLNAFGEVEDTLNSLAMNKKHLTLTEQKVQEAKQSFKLATIQYQNGSIDFTTYLEAQKSYFSAQEELVSKTDAQLQSLVLLHKVLGGGWRGKIESE